MFLRVQLSTSLDWFRLAVEHIPSYLLKHHCISYRYVFASFFTQCANLFISLKPARSWYDYEYTIFNLVLLSGIFRSSYDNALRWMSRDLTDDKSTLVQVMAWCCQATNHYLSQCWPRSMSPHGITRPQWVNSLRHGDSYMHEWTRSYLRADSRFAPSQWETALLCNDVSHWLGTNLELALYLVQVPL